MQTMESLESFYIEVLRSILDHHEDWIAVWAPANDPHRSSACMRRYGPVGKDSYKLDIEDGGAETEEFFGTMVECMNQVKLHHRLHNKGEYIMNRQEAFDIAAKHLLAQGKKSRMKDDDYLCAYRGSDGLKCAIGALIPDDQYTGLECMNVTILLAQPDCPPILMSGDLTKDFLQTLQDAHDDAHGDGDVEEFRRNLSYFAHSWQLDTSVLEEK